MSKESPLIYMIAGEASGDALGAKLMRALKEAQPACQFIGVGGEKMQQLGFSSLFPMQELSLLGFLEIIPHIPKLLGCIRQTGEDILAKKPDVVVTIDAPAFNRRVAKWLKKRGATMPLVHYVAPSVWAYKPSRARKMAALFDHILCLLPFEPPYFEEHGLKATFIGHPVVEEPIREGEKFRFYANHNIDPLTPLLAVMPGSRSSELKRLLPVFEKTTSMLRKKYPSMRAVVFSTEGKAAFVKEQVRKWTMPCIVVSDPLDKPDALMACKLALAKSGTNTLEIAMAEKPMVVAYKVHPLSAWLLRQLIMVGYVNLINILHDAPVIPELLQEECTPEKLAKALEACLDDETPAHQHATLQQKLKSYQALKMLGMGERHTPSQRAAAVVLEMVR